MRGLAVFTSVALLPCLAAAAQRPREQTHFEKGVELYQTHDDSGEAMAEAEKEFRLALRVNPRHAPATAYLGFIAEERDDLREAEAMFRQALILDGKCAEGR